MKDLFKLKMELEATKDVVTYGKEFYALDLSSRYAYKVTYIDIFTKEEKVYADTLTGTTLYNIRSSRDTYNRACFAVFRDAAHGRSKATLRYHINCDPSVNSIRHFCNYCWMSKKQLIDHIEGVKTIIPEGWSYEFLDTEGYEDEFGKSCFFIEFKFNLDIIKRRRLLFILTWIRHCCEFSGNYALYDAMLIQKAYKDGLAPEAKELAEYPVMEIFHVTNKAYRGYFKYDQSLGGINVFPVMDGLDRLKKELENPNHISSSLISLYDDRLVIKTVSDSERETAYYKIERGCKKFEDSEKMCSLDWLSNFDIFLKERLPIHLENWDIMKQLHKESYEQQ